MTQPAHTTCPDGHPLFLCGLCALVFEEGHADPLEDGSRRCPQCLMGETGDFFGPYPQDAIIHDSQFL